MTAAAVRARDVLSALYDGCNGLVEFRALPAKVTGFFALSDVEAIAAWVKTHSDHDVFWGVATRKDTTSGELRNCQDLPAVWVDVDDKDRPSAEILERRASLPFPASLVIDSGGGQHSYFLLRDPLDLQNPADVTTAYNLLRRLAVYLGGDVAAAEPARILRVPTTLNWKYTPPRTVRIRTFEPARRYNASELLEWLPPAPAFGSGRAQPVDLSQPITKDRNVTLYRFGRALKGKQLPSGLIAEAVAFVNERCCRPALEEAELREIVDHVLHQPDRPRPDDRQPVTIEVG